MPADPPPVRAQDSVRTTATNAGVDTMAKNTKRPTPRYGNGARSDERKLFRPTAIHRHQSLEMSSVGNARAADVKTGLRLTRIRQPFDWSMQLSTWSTTETMACNRVSMPLCTGAGIRRERVQPSGNITSQTSTVELRKYAAGVSTLDGWVQYSIT